MMSELCVHPAVWHAAPQPPDLDQTQRERSGTLGLCVRTQDEKGRPTKELPEWKATARLVKR